MNPEDAKLLALIRHLLEKSKAGKVPWEPGQDPNVFAISLPSYTVSIDRVPAAEEQPATLSFRISDPEGTPILYLAEFEAKELGFADMRELFFAARKTALRLGEVLDTLSQELEEVLHQK